MAVINLRDVPKGGATDDGEHGFIVLEDTRETRTTLFIRHDAIPSMQDSLRQLENMVRMKRSDLGKELSSVTVDICENPQVILDVEAGCAILEFPHAGNRSTRVMVDHNAAVTLAGALLDAVERVADVQKRPN